MEDPHDVLFIIDKFSKNQPGTIASPPSSTPQKDDNSTCYQNNPSLSQKGCHRSGVAGTTPRTERCSVASIITKGKYATNSSTSHDSPNGPSFNMQLLSTCPASSGNLGNGSTWIHLATPNLTFWLQNITLPAESTIQGEGSAVVSRSSAVYKSPQVTVNSGSDILECLSLDATALRTSKLKALIKGVMIGFRYNHYAHGDSMSEVRKFQIKFNSSTESGQCAMLLSQYIECRAVSGSSMALISPFNSCLGVSRAPSHQRHHDQQPQQQQQRLSSRSVSAAPVHASPSTLSVGSVYQPIPPHQQSGKAMPTLPPAPTRTVGASTHLGLAAPIMCYSGQVGHTSQLKQHQSLVQDEMVKLSELSAHQLTQLTCSILTDPCFPGLLSKVGQVWKRPVP